MKAKCCVCGTERERDNCTVLTTTAAEKAAIAKAGQIPASEYVYCKPCANLLKDKEKGAALMRGLIAARLRAAGDPRADAIAQRMYDFLVSKAKGPVS